MANEILNSAEDIVLIRPAEKKDNYVYAVRPDFATRKKYFEATISNPAETGVSAFGGHWAVDEKAQEINGSSTFLGLRFDKALRGSGLWVPGVLEARVLDSKGKLTNGIYRDFGMAVYSDSNPNKEIAHSLIERAGREGWQLPLLAPFRSLDYRLNSKAQYGVDVFFVDAPKGVTNGMDAVKVLSQFNWKGDSGARGLYRSGGGGWYASWNLLADSYAYGRVGDWICGEAARADLEKANSALNERRYGAKIKELQKQMETETDLFAKELGAN